MFTRRQTTLRSGLALKLCAGLVVLSFSHSAAAAGRHRPGKATPGATAPTPTATPTAAPTAAAPAAAGTAGSPAAKPDVSPAAGSATLAASTAAPAAAATPARSEPAHPAPPSQLSSTDGPKQEAARSHYMRGVELYQQSNYANAWLEFTSAYQLVPLTALLNNMARCEVKIGRPAEALVHFKNYIAATPNDPDAEYIRQEIARLDAELGRRAAPSRQAAGDSDAAPKESPRRNVPTGSIVFGATTVATLIAGLATIGASSSRFNSLDSTCKPVCNPMDVNSVQQMSYAGYGLLGTAGAAAIVTGIMLSIELRKPKESILRPLAGIRLFNPTYAYGGQ